MHYLQNIENNLWIFYWNFPCRSFSFFNHLIIVVLCCLIIWRSIRSHSIWRHSLVFTIFNIILTTLDRFGTIWLLETSQHQGEGMFWENVLATSGSRRLYQVNNPKSREHQRSNVKWSSDVVPLIHYSIFLTMSFQMPGNNSIICLVIVKVLFFSSSM